MRWFASSATGPFYCPADQTVYLDASFFDQMAAQLKASGDFAQAYVIAHEVGHHVQARFQSLEPGDIREALTAASAIGDDRLQRQSSGRVVPDSFTHGTSEQRLRWFYAGFESGDLSQADTFEMPYERL